MCSLSTTEPFGRIYFEIEAEAFKDFYRLLIKPRQALNLGSKHDVHMVATLTNRSGFSKKAPQRVDALSQDSVCPKFDGEIRLFSFVVSLLLYMTLQ
jgi:hypothetical protein